MIWNYFDKIYCINLEIRKDRWDSSLTEFDRVGIKAERFNAYTGENKHLSFNKSQHECLKKALEDGCNTFLVLEDDVEFKSFSHLRSSLVELPEEWDILYLGANLIGSDVMRFKAPAKVGQHLSRVYDCWQTHAIAYTREVAKMIVNTFKPDDFPIYDEWLRQNVLKNVRAYVVNPQIAVQRPDYSDIWQRDVDYTSCFTQGNNVMS